MIEEGKVYYLSTAKVDIAKKQFATVKNDYEIVLQRDTQISLVGLISLLTATLLFHCQYNTRMH